jgi:peptide/nickel transport system substrate-binding protein
VGSGPFKFVSQVPDQEVVLQNTYEYYMGVPKFDKLVYRVIDNANFANALLSNQADVVWDALNQDTRKQVEGQNGIHSEQVRGGTMVWLMTANAQTLPEKVRQAIKFAVDRQIMVDSILNGEGIVTGSPAQPGSPYQAKLDTKPDLAKAKQLIKEAGFEGKTITLGVSTQEERQRMALFVQQDLAQLGIKVEIMSGDSTGILADIRNGKYDLGIFAFTGGTTPWALVKSMVNPDVPNYVNAKQPMTQYYNAYNLMDSEMDDTKRYVIAQNAQKLTDDAGLINFLSHQYQYVTMSRKLSNLNMPNMDAVWEWQYHE